MSKGFIIKKRKNLNQYLERSPDPYEFKNSKETFAVNFEHFLYDPNYSCHRPIYYNYYSDLFKIKPHADSKCKINNKMVLSSDVRKCIPRLRSLRWKM